MRNKRLHIATGALLLLWSTATAQYAETDRPIPPGGALLQVEKSATDTLFLANLPRIHVFPKQQHVTKKQEEFHWRTVRDVKKALPVAKIVGAEMRKTNKILFTLPDDKARKEYLSKYEKELFAQYEPMLRQFTISQGKMLIKLIDRECQQNSYDLIRIYRGGFTAFFWQGIAYLFGANLKTEYDPEGEDRNIEQVIRLVEAGQL